METEDYFSVFTKPLHGPPSQRRRYKTLYGTQTGRDDLFLMSVIDLLFYYLWLQAGGYFTLYHSSILSLWTSWVAQIGGVKTNVCAGQDLYDSKQSHFVHTRRYSKHKMKVPW